MKVSEKTNYNASMYSIKGGGTPVYIRKKEGQLP